MSLNALPYKFKYDVTGQRRDPRGGYCESTYGVKGADANAVAAAEIAGYKDS